VIGMFEGAAGAGLYFGLKYLAYSAWMLYALKLFADRVSVPRALRLGLGRSAMGIGVGALIFVGGILMLAATSNSSMGIVASQVIVYLCVYVPVRWIEWGIMEAVVRRPRPQGGSFLSGYDGRGRLWRMGGIAVSCLADVVMIWQLGSLPLGRFMC
jgi:hypothetical protein